MTYTCKLCGATSDEREFYSGVTSRCKECHKEKVRENRAQKADYYRAYDAKRFQEDPRVRERHRRYRATEAGKYAMGKSREKWDAKNPEKRGASMIVNSRIKSGLMVKPDTCEKCGEISSRIEGHHEDYGKPLEVIWLCRQCHVNIHKVNP